MRFRKCPFLKKLCISFPTSHFPISEVGTALTESKIFVHDPAAVRDTARHV